MKVSKILILRKFSKAYIKESSKTGRINNKIELIYKLRSIIR